MACIRGFTFDRSKSAFLLQSLFLFAPFSMTRYFILSFHVFQPLSGVKGELSATEPFLGSLHIYYITKTRLYKFDLLEPHFYIVKLGFTGVYIIFLISAQNMRRF